ncbi:hypothetical protein [Microcystis phage MJing1]|nr:hypothetical protein [Microcystis phage MJing1]
MLGTYSALRTSIGNWLNRPDLVSVIPDFIALAEADIARKLRCREMERPAEATFSGEPVSLPTDWLEAVRVSPEGKAPLQPVTPQRLQELRAQKESGALRNLDGWPHYFSVVGNRLELFPEPVGTITLDMVYYQRVPALSDDAPTNWLLTTEPNIYLYGSLAQSAPYLKQDARLATWAAIYADAITSKNAASARSRYAGGALVRTRRGFA